MVRNKTNRNMGNCREYICEASMSDAFVNWLGKKGLAMITTSDWKNVRQMWIKFETKESEYTDGSNMKSDGNKVRVMT